MSFNEDRIPFSIESTTSFADLASSNQSLPTGANSLSSHILSHTLSEYGPIIDAYKTTPAPTDSPLLTPTYVSQPLLSSDPMGPLILRSDAHLLTPSGFNSGNTLSNSSINYTPDTNTLYQSTHENVLDSANNMIVQTSTSVQPPRDALLYSPPLVDQTSSTADAILTPTINPNTGRPYLEDELVGGKIPKKSETNTVDPLAGFGMSKLQEFYHEFDVKLKNLKSIRDDIVKEIGDILRRSQGRNVENDVVFRKKKDSQLKCEREIDNMKEKMKKISEKLSADFGYKIERTESFKGSGFGSKGSVSRRAKMSTTPASISKQRSDSNNDKSFQSRKYLLDLKDTATWCKMCDLHFESLRDYSNHLHTHQHRQKMKKSTPWRSEKLGDPIDRRKTYDMMRSMCDKLKNELGKNFGLIDVDDALTADLPNKRETLKDRFLERERGRFDEDDVMFKIRGYDYIVPVPGFYCNLCSMKLCDHLEFEQHIKSYQHVYAHFKSIAINPKYESDISSQYSKSYKKHFPTIEPAKSAQTDDPQQPHQSKSVSAYKKATSRIVDEHETIANKFPPRTAREMLSKSDKPSAKGTNKQTDEANSEISIKEKSSGKLTSPHKRKNVYDDVPGIVPITKGNPSALKRLRTTLSDIRKAAPACDALSDRSSSPSIISEYGPEDKGNESQEHKLNVGDDDSPFPDYQLSVCGNHHESVLKDKRLSMPVEIKLTPMNLDDYKDLLLDSSSVWSRINHLVAKREKINNLKANQISRVQTKPTYYTTDGKQMAVDLADIEEERQIQNNDVQSYFSVLDDFFCEK